jgi:hypothetical protein
MQTAGFLSAIDWLIRQRRFFWSFGISNYSFALFAQLCYLQPPFSLEMTFSMKFLGDS